MSVLSSVSFLRGIGVNFKPFFSSLISLDDSSCDDMFIIFGSVVLRLSNNSPVDVIVVVGDIEFVGACLVEMFF